MNSVRLFILNRGIEKTLINDIKEKFIDLLCYPILSVTESIIGWYLGKLSCVITDIGLSM